MSLYRFELQFSPWFRTKANQSTFVMFKEMSIASFNGLENKQITELQTDRQTELHI